MKISAYLLCGSNSATGFVDGTFEEAKFGSLCGIAMTSPTKLTVSDRVNDALRVIDLDSQQVTTVEQTSLNKPRGVFATTNGLLVCDTGSSSIKIILNDQQHIISGQKPGYTDGQIGTARFDRPSTICESTVDQTIFVCDCYNHCIRYIKNEVKTLAGSGKPGYSDKICQKQQSMLRQPADMVCLKDGNLLVCDCGNNTVRHVHVGAGLVTTVVGGTHSKFFCNYLMKKNKHFDPTSIHDREREPIIVEEVERITRIHALSSKVVRPTTICQLPSGVVVVVCQNAIFVMNEALDDIQQCSIQDLQHKHVPLSFTKIIPDPTNSKAAFATTNEAVWRLVFDLDPIAAASAMWEKKLLRGLDQSTAMFQSQEIQNIDGVQDEQLEETEEGDKVEDAQQSSVSHVIYKDLKQNDLESSIAPEQQFTAPRPSSTKYQSQLQQINLQHLISSIAHKFVQPEDAENFISTAPKQTQSLLSHVLASIQLNYHTIAADLYLSALIRSKVKEIVKTHEKRRQKLINAAHLGCDCASLQLFSSGGDDQFGCSEITFNGCMEKQLMYRICYVGHERKVSIKGRSGDAVAESKQYQVVKSSCDNDLEMYEFEVRFVHPPVERLIVNGVELRFRIEDGEYGAGYICEWRLPKYVQKK